RTEAVRLAQEVRLPFTEVFTPQETVRDAHLEARGALVEIDHPVAPRVRQPGPAALLSETPWRTERAPLTGEHSGEVLRDLLGMSEDEVEALRQSGVVA